MRSGNPLRRRRPSIKPTVLEPGSKEVAVAFFFYPALRFQLKSTAHLETTRLMLLTSQPDLWKAGDPFMQHAVDLYQDLEAADHGTS